MDIQISHKFAALTMSVVGRDTEEGFITLQHDGEDGFVTLLTIPLKEWDFLFPSDQVMVDIIITRVGKGETTH